MSTSLSKKTGFWSNVKEITVLLSVVFLIRTFGFGLYQVPTGSMEVTMLVGERFFADKLTPLFSPIKRGEIIAFNDPLYKYSTNKFVRIFQEYVWGPHNWTKRVIGQPGDILRGVTEEGKPVIYLNGTKLNETYVNEYPLLREWQIDPREVAIRLVNKGVDGLGDLFKTKSFDPEKPFDNTQPFYYIKEERIIKEGKDPIVLYPGTPVNQQNEGLIHKDGNSYWTGSDEFYVELGENQYWVMGDNRLGSTDSRWFGPIDGRLIHSRIMFCIWSIDTQESWWILDLIKNPINFWTRVRWGRIPRYVR